MGFLEISVKIVEENSCPLYELGDEFKISGNALSLPQGKPACLMLTKDVTRVLIDWKSRDELTGEKKEQPGFYNCSGCMGIIRYEAKKEDVSIEMPEELHTNEELGALITTLQRFPLFKPLNQRSIYEIISTLKTRKFDCGDFILQKGDPGTNLYIIVSGKVEVLGSDNVNIAFLGKGEVFGEMSLLSGDPVGASIKVVEPTTVMFLDGGDFRRACKKYPALQMYFAQLLARRLARTNVEMAGELASGMTGKLSDITPTELFQALNSNQKTGILTLSMPDSEAELSFKEGGLIGASYRDLEGEEAFFALLKESQGRFKFFPGLPPEDMEANEIGDFMWLLMEGLNRIDEGS